MELGAHMGRLLMRWPHEVRQHLVREAERLGYGSVWTAESMGCDGATPLGMIATLTERVRVGAAVFQMPARSPAMTAMTAVALDRLSEGRFVLGIGASTKPVTEDWHGQSFAHQLARTRDYVTVLRQALAGERLEIDSEALTLPGTGRPMRMVDKPMQERIPILIGAIGPKNVALCGEIADGWIATMVPPEGIRSGMERIEAAAAEAGRELGEDFDTVLHAMTSIDDDPVVARNRLRPMLTVHAGMGPPERNPYRRRYDELGFKDELEVVTEQFLAGRVEEARAALPDELIDTVTLCGTRETVAARAAEYREAGVTTLMANFLDDDPEGWERNLRLLSEIQPRIVANRHFHS